MSVRSINSVTVSLYGLTRAKKEQKIGPKKGPKYKITYYEAKWDFKVPEMLRGVGKLFFYLNKSAEAYF